MLRPTAKISPSKADATSVGAMTEAVPQLCVSASDKATSGCRGGRRVCAGCGAPIRDQYILRVAPDLEWHAACLKCADCHQFLDETCTCFVRDGKTYCKRDYVRLFGTKCSKCRQGFSRTDFVMRARQHVYHLDCFRCQACARQLIPGDEFALREDGLFCRADHDVLDKFASSAAGGGPATATGPTNGIHVAPNAEPLPVGGPGVPRAGGQAGAGGTPPAQPRGHPQSKQQQHGGGTAAGGGDGQQSQQQQQHKPTRVRTVLNEKQLHTLRTCYAANPRPDALMKEQLVEMTGLSPRVIRVWFQNKRCKDGKKSLLMKQMQQHEKDGRPLSLGSLRGVPMVASSPVRHEGSSSPQPLEVHAYQPPWKALAEYAMHPNDVDPSAPHFRHLVNQMHGYDTGDPGCLGVLPLGGHYLCADDGLGAPPSNLSSHHSSHLPGTPSELSSPTSE